MAEIILHDTLVIMGQEGSFATGFNQFNSPNHLSDVRFPHVPPYNSGVTLSFGYDIGASGTTPEQLQEVLSAIGVEQAMIDALVPACGKKGGGPAADGYATTALDWLKQSKVYNKVQLTQQQVLDLLYVQHKKYKDIAAAAFPKSFSQLHGIIQEVLTKICYGLPAAKTVVGAYDSQLAAVGSDHKAQCDIMLKKVLTAYINNFDKPKVHRGHTKLIQLLVKELEAGNTVSLTHEPLTVDAFLSPDNPTADWRDYVNHFTHGLGKMKDDPTIAMENVKKKNTSRTEVAKHRDQADIDNPGTKLNAEEIERLHAIVTSKNKKGGGNSAEVKAAQEKLIELGCFERAGVKGSADGDLGPKTKKALLLFQKENNLPQTGALDEATKKALLGSPKTEKPPQQNPPTQNNGNNQEDNKSWWDKIVEIAEAAQKNAAIEQQKWWAAVAQIHTKGMIGLLNALALGKITSDALNRIYSLFKQLPQTDNSENVSVAPIPLDAAVFCCFN